MLITHSYPQDKLIAFVRESNAIEGYHYDPKGIEIEAHNYLLSTPELTVADVSNFVMMIANAPLRDRFGMDVRVGNHYPPRGGVEVRYHLDRLLQEINAKLVSPFEAHHRYETLHPFMDGNGRSGRAIWLWHMQRNNERMHRQLSFLHTWYYQSLDGRR